MQAQEIEQIKNILANIEASQKKIPYLSDLEQHPGFLTDFFSADCWRETRSGGGY